MAWQVRDGRDAPGPFGEGSVWTLKRFGEGCSDAGIRGLGPGLILGEARTL